MNRHQTLCTESLRSGGNSAAKSLKFPGPTTCIVLRLLLALSLPLSCPLMRYSRQLARNETGVKVPFSELEKWQTSCDWSASVNGSEFSLKQTFVGKECVTSPRNLLKQLAKRNVPVKIFNCSVKIKTKDCARSRPFQHKFYQHCFHGKVS